MNLGVQGRPASEVELRFPTSEYLEWDRVLPPDANHVGGSGVPTMAEDEMGRLILQGRSGESLDLVLDPDPVRGFGSASAKAAIAARYRVRPEQVYPTEGASMATFLAAAALLDGGGHALVEEPVYTPLLRQIEGLADRVDRVSRPFSEGFALDPERLGRSLHPETRLVAVTELHNPSGVRLGNDVLIALAERCAQVGAHLLVDEVYKDYVFDEPPGTTAALAPNIVAASSLTKVYGLGPLRFGWIIGPPAVIERAARINLHLAVHQPGPVVALGVRALGVAEALRARARDVLARSWPLLRRWIDEREDLEVVWPQAGSIVFPRWRGGDTGALVDRLLAERRTVVVPGRFFIAPWGMRLSATATPDRLIAGLAELGAALDREMSMQSRR
jgi:aspartate/methionine/tyrosine aminotransferase